MTNLLVSDVVGGGGAGLLHCHQAQDLHQVVLHHVADDAELIEVAAAPLRPERLLEGDEHRGDVVPVPRRPEDPVAEPVGRRKKRGSETV